MYRVEIKGFSNKVYKLDNIQDILDEIKIFTDIENIVSIQKVDREEIYNQVIQEYSHLQYEFEGDKLQDEINKIIDNKLNK